MMWSHSPSKKALGRWRPSTAPLAWMNLPSKPSAGVLASSGSSHGAFTEGKEVSSCTVLFIYIFFSAYLQSDQGIIFFEACEPMSAEESGCFGVVFKRKPHSTREYGIWEYGMEGLLEGCICGATGLLQTRTIMQAEWYLHGDKALPRALTPSNIPPLNPQLCLPAQAVSILPSRELCSFGGSIIIGEIMLWSHAFQQDWLMTSYCSCPYSGRAAVWTTSCRKHRGWNLIAINILGQIIAALIQTSLEQSVLFCSGVFGWKWRLRPSNSRFAICKKVVWILIFRGSRLGRGAHDYLSTCNPKWLITEPLQIHDTSSEPCKLAMKTARYETYSTTFENQMCRVDVHWQSQLFTDERHMVMTSHHPVETRGPRRSVGKRNSRSCESCDPCLLSPLGVVSLGCGAASGSSSQAQAVPLLLHPPSCHWHCGTTTSDSFPAKPKANSFTSRMNLTFHS